MPINSTLLFGEGSCEAMTCSSWFEFFNLRLDRDPNPDPNQAIPLQLVRTSPGEPGFVAVHFLPQHIAETAPPTMLCRHLSRRSIPFWRFPLVVWCSRSST